MTTRNPRLEAVVSLRDEASRALKGLTAQTKKFEKQIKRTGQAMTLMGGAILGLAAVAVKMSSSLEESMNAVSVVFKSGAQDIIDFGKIASTQVGLTANDFQQMATLTGALLRDVGLSEAEVAQETIRLTKRAADMASVFDTDVKDAFFAINAAIRGETEAIRRFAGDVTDATLQMTAFELGITKAVTQMTEQEKRLLRIETIMRQTSDTQDDFRNTAESFANQTRIVTAQIKDQAAVIGAVLLPVAKELIGIIGLIVTKVVAWSKENPELFATIVKVTAAVGLALAVLGPLLVILPGIISGIAALGVVISALLGPIGLAILAVTAFSVAYATNFLGIRDITNKVVKFVIDLFNSWVGWFLPTGPLIKGILFLKDNWRELTDAITMGIETAVNFVIGKLRDLLGVLAEVARFLNLDMAEGLDGLVEKLGDVEIATDKVIDGIKKELMEELEQLAKTVKVAASEIDKLAEAEKQAMLNARELMERVGEFVKVGKEAAEVAGDVEMSMKGWADQFDEVEREMVSFSKTFSNRTKQIIHDRDLAFAIEPLTPFEELLSDIPGLLDAFSLGMIDASQAAIILAGQTGLINEALVEQVGQITTLQDKWEAFIKATKGADQFSGAIAGQFNLGPEETLRGPGRSGRRGRPTPVFNPRFSQGTPSDRAVVVDDQGNVIRPPVNTEQSGTEIAITLSESLDTGMGKMVSE